MDEKRLAALRLSFAKKPTRELRAIVEAADSGDWAEEAVVVAKEILATHPEEAASEEAPAKAAPVDPGRPFAPRPPLPVHQLAIYRDVLKFVGWIYMILAFVPLGVVFYVVRTEAGLTSRGSLFLFALAALIGLLPFFTGFTMRRPTPGSYHTALTLAGVTALLFLLIGIFGNIHSSPPTFALVVLLIAAATVWLLRKCKPVFFHPELERETRKLPAPATRKPKA